MLILKWGFFGSESPISGKKGKKFTTLVENMGDERESSGG